LSQLQVLTWVVGHELGHTVLWHQPNGGHHSGATTYDCLIWQWVDWRVNPPTEFCAQNPGYQTRWKLNP
jgi:predicted SprT family Zn-dependent metalloprotease